MTNRKETLIEALRGSIAMLDGLEEKMEGVSLYDETGHVDCDFFVDALTCLSGSIEASNKMIGRLSELLAPNAGTASAAKKPGRKGAERTPEEVLKQCTLEDNVLRLPNVQFSKKTYDEVKKRILEAGGAWQGGKVMGFTFPFDASRVTDGLKEKGRCRLQKDFQFFETPDETADWLVSLAGGIAETDTVLEPSAGRGAIVRAVRRACPSATVDCCELMPENRQLLRDTEGVRLIGEDFTALRPASLYTKIIANPPFSGNQDIAHVRRMWDLLAPGGVLAAITSRHWQCGEERPCSEFRKWLESVGGRTFEIEENTFRDSGTSIGTMAVVISKEAELLKRYE